MKNLEQRVEELELEVKLLKAKNKLEKTKKLDYLFSHSDQEFIDQEFITKFGLETTFASPWDYSENIECPLNPIMVSLSSTLTDNFLPNSNYVDSSDLPEYYPPYPNIISSWDDFDQNTMKEWAEFNQTDAIPPYPRHEDICLERLNSTEQKIEKEFGKIVSKFKILTHEWEMDGYGYVINDKNDKRIIVTNHGNPMIVDSNYLNDIISGYKERIQETQRALFLMK
jgi:hypothetical protein